MKKNNKRIFIIATIVVVCLIGLIAKLDVKPANYYSAKNESTAMSEEYSEATTYDINLQTEEQPTSEASSSESSTIEKNNKGQKDTNKDNNTSTSDSNTTSDSKPGAPTSNSTDNESQKSDSKPTSNPANNQEGNKTSNTNSNTQKPKDETVTCTIEIRCDTLNGGDNLTDDAKDAGKIPYAKNPTILGTYSVTVPKGQSVYDVLLLACRNNGIHVEASYTAMYESYYVEGINHLYEFDGGQLSGWMYKVNGQFPNYGCSSYTVEAGDVIVWLYTCDLGKDVGDNSMW